MTSSIIGRPRVLTEAQIEEILAWHRHRETMRQLAERLGVSTATIRAVIRTEGRHYKTPSPERRPAALAAIRRVRRTRQRGE